MADDHTGWRRETSGGQHNDDREWRRRTEDDRRQNDDGRGRDWDRDFPRARREDYPRSDSGRDWSSPDWSSVDRSGRDRGQDWSSRGGGEGWRDRRPSENRGDWRDQGRDQGRRWAGRDYDRPGRLAGVPGGAWGFDEWGRDPGWDYGWSSGYGRDYGPRYANRDGYDRDRDSYGGSRDYRGRPSGERGWWDRASDEVSAWFGDEGAAQRRNEDGRRDNHYRGRGPRGYTRSDERIRDDVSDRLTDNPILDASDVEVAVSKCEVTLSGHVDSRYSKRLAEDLAEDVSGVRHVQNNLRVREHHEWGSTTIDASSGEQRSGVTDSSGPGKVSGTMAGTTSGDTSGNATAGTTPTRTTTR